MGMHRDFGWYYSMPEYRRFYVPGGTYFLTLVTYQRAPIFREAETIMLLRRSLRQVRHEHPFEIPAAVVLPDHVHFVWTLPRGDSSYSRRIGLMKVLLTRSLRERSCAPIKVGLSRPGRRESDVWQRRFWEHTIIDEDDFERHLHYIHYNPVKHGLAACPHLWPYSSFSRWVRGGLYAEDWGCSCGGRRPQLPEMAHLEDVTGE
jgi:putative transposase